MGEHPTERVRGQMLTKILSFEVGWFDEDENSSALIGDHMCLFLQTAVGKGSAKLCQQKNFSGFMSDPRKGMPRTTSGIPTFVTN
ncbi:hypothetical protein E2562_000222 [Oryza meyeriana var. granulata]|uniref:Uncharacterized protein n=1 Tax=Oryza meyeriana var. granulata TaxID=110450 RepID=A0A6G1CLL8_9ORYZ|nr:hypothetical protein E2562_000222 [Oryza meyeriana var. granulata]